MPNSKLSDFFASYNLYNIEKAEQNLCFLSPKDEETEDIVEPSFKM